MTIGNNPISCQNKIGGREQPECDLRTQNNIQWLSVSMAVDLALYCALGLTSSPFSIRTPLRYLLYVVPCISANRLMYGTVSRTSLLDIRCRLCWLRGRSHTQQDCPVAEEGVLWHALRHHVSRVVAGGNDQEDDGKTGNTPPGHSISCGHPP